MSEIFGISKQDVRKVMNKDAKRVSSHPDKYIEANEESYYLLCNTWLRVCYDASGSLAVRVLYNSILREGLLKTIDECNRIANEAIRSGFTAVIDTPLRALLNEDIRLTLQVLRYPKRFSPAEADLVRAEGLRKFLRVNLNCKGQPAVITETGKVLKRYKEYPRWLIADVKAECARMLKKTDLSDDNILLHGRFSSGATAEGDKTLLAKYKTFAKREVRLFNNPLYPVGDKWYDDLDYVKVVAVPKSYKTPRIIAECSTRRQFYLQGVRALAEDSIKKSKLRDYIVLEDQTINQEWSRLGSIYQTYATLDLSSASDSISECLAQLILPKDWYDAIAKYNAANLNVNGKLVPRYIFQTSGNATTFVFESIIFLAIANVATRYVSLMTKKRAKLPRVYGDDLICDSAVYDTLADFLDLLGFTVNLDKSFTGDHFYRESCGAEWFLGVDTSTKYFPRKTLDFSDPTFLQSGISLQHKLYEFKTCDEWLVRYLRSIAQNFGLKILTSSDPGTDCDDLWEEFPYYMKVNPPIDRGKIQEAPFEIRREVHTCLQQVEPPTAYWTKHPLLPHEYELMEMFRYVMFLKDGPRYDEYGISIPPRTYTSDACIMPMKFVNVKR